MRHRGGAAAIAALLLMHAAVLHPALAANPKDDSTWGGLPERLSNALVMHHEANAQFEENATPWVEQVGLHPRSYVFHNFLTMAERAHIVRLAAPKLRRSTVVGEGGEGVIDNIRTSYGMFIRRLADPIIERIEKRIALWTHLPIQHQEDIQVLRYAQGQTYGAHYDSGDQSNEPGPKWRLATFLMYLSDVEEGGETAFPMGSVWADPTIPDRVGKVSDCAKGHVAAKPKAGDAVLFYSFYPNNTMDPAAMHTGCPIIKGVKWAAPVWMHDIPFRPTEIAGGVQQTYDFEADAGACVDGNSRCADWAAAGECSRNKGFMAGDLSSLGACRKSCKSCESCASSDMECINRNRERGGYWPLNKDELEWLGAGDLWKEDKSPDSCHVPVEHMASFVDHVASFPLSGPWPNTANHGSNPSNPKDDSTWGGLPERLLPNALVMVSVGWCRRGFIFSGHWLGADTPDSPSSDNPLPLAPPFQHHEANAQFEEDATPWVEQVGLHPRSYVFHNFLTMAERAHLVRLAAPKLKRSLVVGSKGEGVVDSIRTSYGMFVRRLADPVVERIEKRIALWTHLPIEHQEDIQILRYQQGQTYGAHYDSGGSSDHIGPKWRLATFLMYLSDVEEGGETAFPMGSVWADPTIPDRVGKVSDCAKGHVAAKPKAGDAVLFYSFYPNNTMDPAAMHTGCPIIKGVKWAAPVWMHDIPFRESEVAGGVQHVQELAADAGGCADLHARCGEWAAAGECEKNKGYMVGDGSVQLGTCRKSCKTCEPCRSVDMECINRNRERGGYWPLNKDELEWLGAGDLWKEDMSPEL
ncbi:Prolyl 4-hydroxylase subunit alpha-1 [Tetrabaena socialis]|uniref:Prolyl 4-hydroxylase subunit alpha-1 n=1 Tax=Tetrabaena socialis TaxID=47790 RepID=A0A2J8AG45_9CHLO|nr:Prolyl 4-hydroxylase subunit alpha-1 [Tetrabaena socialis]|eukprot:PNH11495.1 Prolyl 4-hydroxylase subunit alpha-1 [Tetrabaena socialis]